MLKINNKIILIFRYLFEMNTYLLLFTILIKAKYVWHYKLQWNLLVCLQSLDGPQKPLPFAKEPKISTFKNNIFEIGGRYQIAFFLCSEPSSRNFYKG